MTPQLALLAYGLLILWLLRQDIRRRPGLSPASWLVVVWVAIIASRPLSAWLGIFGGGEISENEMDGNSLDRNVFLLLIVVALVILKRRNINWRVLVANNRWLFLCYLFFGLSVAWSGP